MRKRAALMGRACCLCAFLLLHGRLQSPENLAAVTRVACLCKAIGQSEQGFFINLRDNGFQLINHPALPLFAPVVPIVFLGLVERFFNERIAVLLQLVLFLLGCNRPALVLGNKAVKIFLPIRAMQ